MPGLATMTVVGIVVVAVLVVVFLKVRQKDLLGAIIEKRRPTAKVVSRADYVEGAEKIPVALSLTNDSLYYENTDLEASFDLQRLDEVEYTDELTTGKNLHEGSHVLRLRSHGAAFEFVLDDKETSKWMAALPARRFGGSSARAV